MTFEARPHAFVLHAKAQRAELAGNLPLAADLYTQVAGCALSEDGRIVLLEKAYRAAVGCGVIDGPDGYREA